MQRTTFHGPISPADRENAYGWNPEWGEPTRHDAHVRAYRMRDDEAVLESMAARFAETAYFQSEDFARDRAAGMWG